MTIRISSRALVILAGPSGAGKTTWARRWFRHNQIVTSDDLRAVVGEHEHDQRAGTDAFEVLDAIVERRLRRGLLTVVDTLGMDAARYETWQRLAADHARPCLLVAFATEAKTCRARNRTRTRPVPAKVLTGQIDRWAELRPTLGDAGFDAVHDESDVVVVPDRFAGVASTAAAQRADPVGLRFGLHIARFDGSGDSATIARSLGEIVAEAEDAGFESVWVMDHFIQIPQVGREWEPMLESSTVLGYLAARTTTARLGTLVTGITYRNIAHVAKIVATLDVLSEGRAMCGLGAAWFEREHAAYGYDFPPVSERYELLEDALRLLPLMWGPGAPDFEGHRLRTPEAICYPRPLQEKVPIMIGGSGERRTLRLVAEYADACNLFGDTEAVRRRVEVLHDHCEAVDRDPADIEVTHLSNAITAANGAELDRRLDALTGDRVPREELARRTEAAPVEEQIGRYRELADAGVQTAIVGIGDVGHPGAVAAFGPVIDAFLA